MKTNLSILALVLVAAISSPITAQTGKGSIAGVAEDAAGARLQGAKAELQPSGASAVSNGQGDFTIANLEPGKYTMTVSYVGFVSYTADVTVAAGVPAKVDAVLKVGSASDEVTVYAERLQGEAEAINIERTAENIVQVLPSRVINSLPNTNIADAVGRAPSVTLERDEGEGKYVSIRGTEPRLSNVTIDGVNVPSPEGGVRNIKLDVVPAGLVDRIEVNKTLSANQDGDAIGGSVNLVTRTPGNKPTYQFGVEGGYTPIQDGRTLTGFNGTVGQRFGAQKKLGLLFGVTYDKNNRGIDDLEPTQATGTDPATGNNIAFVAGEDLRYYKYYRTRYGFDTSIDYNFKQGSSVFLRGLYSDFHDYGDTRVYTANFGKIIGAVNGSQITFADPGSFQYRHYIRRPDQQVFSVLTGVRHEINSWLLTTDFAVSRGHNIGGQDFPTTHFSGPSANLGLNLSNPLIPKFNILDGTNVFDPTKYTFADTSLPRYHSTQLNIQGAAALARTYSLNSHFATFEIGAKVRDAHKTQNQDDHVYSPVSGTFLSLDQVLASQTDPTYYDRALPFGSSSDYRKIQQLVQPGLGTSLMTDTVADGIASALATWDLHEPIYAGYAMNTIGFGKLRLQTGVRIEATDASYRANKFTKNPPPPLPQLSSVSGSGGSIDVLPSIQMQYALPHDTNLRATYGIGISRPNFQDQVPAEQFDPNTSPQTRQKGNPDLKPTKAQNFDVLIEHYFRPLGILQGGFFYKALSNPIYPTGQIVNNILVLQSINGPKAHIAGVEMAWEQRLSFLPGLLSGLGVSANYSYTTSRVDFPSGFSGGRVDHPSLQRQAPNTWNLGATYDKARLSMRFGVSHNDANIYAYQYIAGVGTDSDPITGIKGPLGDQYLYAHTQYDVQGSYRLFKGLHATVSGLNLSNEVFGFYTGSPKYPNQREFYKPTVTFGLRWTSASE